MTFDFELPNTEPTMLVIESDQTFSQNMASVMTNPPQYDQRTITDLIATSECEHLDKLDAYAVASAKFNEQASKYANSETGRQFHFSTKNKK